MVSYVDCGNFVMVFGTDGPQEQRPLTPAERALLDHIQVNHIVDTGVLGVAVDLCISYRYTRCLINRLASRGLIRVSRGSRRRLVLHNASREGVC